MTTTTTTRTKRVVLLLLTTMCTSLLISMSMCAAVEQKSPSLSSSPKATPFVRIPAVRRVYTTNMLRGFKRDFPALYPPGFFDTAVAGNRTVLDIGANDGSDYTLTAARAGHTVISFEPSPSLFKTFQRRMIEHGIALSVVEIPEREQRRILALDNEGNVSTTTTMEKNRKAGISNESESKLKVIIPRDDAQHPRVYLLPFAASRRNAQVPFYESKCTPAASSMKCGKTNRVLTDQVSAGPVRKATTMVNTFRLDDLQLPVPGESLWFVKIDVEGHEVDVLRGGHDLLSKYGNIEYVAVEFSANGRRGTKWGTELLDELHNVGFTCFHLRGFGQCHDASEKSPSMGCNYPFDRDGDQNVAPTFKEYSKVFEVTDSNQKERPRMSDLMCKRRW